MERPQPDWFWGLNLVYSYLEYIFLSTIKVLSQTRQCCGVKLCQTTYYYAHIFYINLCWKYVTYFNQYFSPKIDNILSLDKFFSSVWLVKTSVYLLICKLGCRVSGLSKKLFARFLNENRQDVENKNCSFLLISCTLISKGSKIDT